jgi:O-antigen ligase
VGIALAIAASGWVVLSSAASGASARGPLLLAVPAVAAYVVGRLTGPRLRVPVASVLMTVVLVSLAVGAHAIPVDRPGAQVLETTLLGYLNADAAWAVQGMALAALVLVASGSGWLRVAAAVVLGLLGLQPALTGSWVAVVGGMLVLLALLLARRDRVAARAATAGLVVVTGVVATTAALGLAHLGEPDATDPAARVLTERRIDLWADAVRISGDHPVTGVGAGGFEETSPTARASRDTKPAHSTWLEAAAELGLPGALLLLALALWPFTALGTGPPAVVGAAAWTAFLLHASVDYVSRSEAVVVLAAFVVGLATDLRRARAGM